MLDGHWFNPPGLLGLAGSLGNWHTKAVAHEQKPTVSEGVYRRLMGSALGEGKEIFFLHETLEAVLDATSASVKKGDDLMRTQEFESINPPDYINVVGAGDPCFSFGRHSLLIHQDKRSGRLIGVPFHDSGSSSSIGSLASRSSRVCLSDISSWTCSVCVANSLN